VLENKKSSLVKNKKRSLTVSIAMFFLWFSWFSMVFFDPVKMDLFWMRYIGLILFVTGVLLFILSHIRIKGFDSDRLVTSGIYSRIRHPMYLGFILWIIGFPMFMQSIITLASSIIWIPQIMYWKKSEERQLEAKYREYGEYKKRTFF
jgi:protein-S-isoprenylcysteine O-methyltransferase Ste14